MLVKCISYIITVFGTKRYKPFLFVGVAVIATFAGVNTIISLYQPAQKPVASSVNTAEADEQTYNSQGLSEQKLKQQDAAVTQQPTEQTTPEQTTPSNTNTTTSPNQAPTPTIQIAQETVTIKANSTTPVTIAASLSDTATAQWGYKLEQATGLTITPTNDKQASSAYTLSVKTDSTVVTGTHTLTVSAKDSTRNLDITKTIKLVIIAE